MTNKDRFIKAVKALIERYDSENVAEIKKMGDGSVCPLCEAVFRIHRKVNNECCPCPMAKKSAFANANKKLKRRAYPQCAEHFDSESARTIEYSLWSIKEQIIQAGHWRAAAFREVLKCIENWPKSRFTLRGWYEVDWDYIDGRELLEAGK